MITVNPEETFAIFRAAVATHFSFLKSERGYRAAAPDPNQLAGIFAFVFIGSSTGVECSIDFRESNIDCKICLLHNGRPPTDYAIDANGVRIREGVSALLRRRGIRERLFTKVTGRTFAERIPVIVGDFGSMFQRYPELLGDFPTVLN